MLVGVLQDGEGSVLVEDPGLPLVGAEAHSSKYDLGNLQARLAQAIQETISLLSELLWRKACT